MAVMTTTLSNDGVILEQKTQPVPSSEKMALDLDINGTTKRDETNLDFEIPKPSVIPNFDSPPNVVDAAELARKQNNEAVANNDSIMEDVIVPDIIKDADVSEGIENDGINGEVEREVVAEEIKTLSASVTIASQTTRIDNSSSADSTNFETSATTTVPPLVEAQESDLREVTIPVSQSEAAEIKATKHAMDLNADPELANGFEKPGAGDESMEGVTNGNGIVAESQSAIQNMSELPAVISENLASDQTTNAAPPAVERDSQKTHNIENLQIATTAQLEQPAQDPQFASNAQDNAQDQSIENLRTAPTAQPDQSVENLQAAPVAQSEQLTQAPQAAPVVQAEQPTQTASPSEPAAEVSMSEAAADIHKPDTDMLDDDLFGESAPPASQTSGNKVAREREEDEDMEAPEAKRMKVDPSMNGGNAALNTSGGDAVEDDDHGGRGRVITGDLLKILKNSVQSARKGKIGASFRQPVAKLWETIAPSYLAKVPHPIDLSIIEKNLTAGTYATLGDYKADVELIVSNCVLFNGPDHEVTRGATALKNYLYNKIPSADFVAPATKSKARRSTPNPDASARRPSRVVNAASPPAPPKAKNETYPLDPITQTPVIRRDSTLGENGRPKRDIHPPKPKDIFTQPNKTNRKKNALELRFCEQLIQDIMKPKNHAMNQFFMEPVDPVALGIPQYFKIIKKPMDLSTIQQRLTNGTYFSAKEFEIDMRQMLDNCFKFNPSDNPVHQKGRDLERYFNTEWEKKTRWMSINAPQRERMQSDSEEEQSDEEEEEVAATTIDASNAERFELLNKIREEQAKLLRMNKEGAGKNVIAVQEQIVGITEASLDRLEKEIEGAKKKGKKVKAPPKVTKKAAAPLKKPKKTKQRYMGHAEKEIISQGIGRLDDKSMQMVISWIKADVEGLDTVEDDNMELDIDAVSEPCLNRLYELVIARVPGIVDSIIPSEPTPVRHAPAPKPKKKNKPMGKSEQEQKIAQLKQVVAGGLAGLSSAPTASAATRYGDSGGPAVEQDEETSGDEDESDSEEED